jgi:hypothetical protein
MTYTYAGENYSKKLARIFNLMRLIDIAFSDHETVITTLSRDLSDIAPLIALGVRPENIYGFDIDNLAVEECKRKYPDVNAFNDDIVNAFKYVKTTASINLDLCCCLSDKMVRHFKPLVTNSNVNGYSITVLKGRDKKVLDYAHKIPKPSCINSPCYGTLFDRAEFFSSYLRPNIYYGKSVTPFPSTLIEYQSSSPMITLNYAGHGIRSGYSTPYGDNIYTVHSLPHNWINRRSLAIAIPKLSKGDLAYILHKYPGIASLLSFDSKQAAAIKAHQTMGRYSTSVCKTILEKIFASIAFSIVNAMERREAFNNFSLGIS